ncbi:hypothetical protein BDV26DRAFT_275282 [Aspergillus bertholletiae]|uniref:Secreted protein n=1 Tax=Aspergillus bertholletiae TaxID=1226010 RepID=A0A5N7ASW4_9EURO|nr:hypothetical protein BDV26DRAFT_275282 [Aspergillus bertholletiae]
MVLALALVLVLVLVGLILALACRPPYTMRSAGTASWAICTRATEAGATRASRFELVASQLRRGTDITGIF